MAKKNQTEEPAEPIGRYARAVRLAKALSHLPFRILHGDRHLLVQVSNCRVGLYYRQKEVTFITGETTLQAIQNAQQSLFILQKAEANDYL